MAATLITGGGGGIASAVAQRLSATSAAIILMDVDEPALVAAKASIPCLTLTKACDLVDWEETARSVAEAADEVGPITTLVNLAGVFRLAGFLDVSPEDWNAQFVTNVVAPANAVRAVLPGMRASGGRVVNVCSIWSTNAGPDRSAYVASKHALLGLTKALAAEFSPEGIEFVAVSPGPVDTGMTRELAPPETRQTWLSPDNVADAIWQICKSPVGTYAGSEVQIFGNTGGFGKGTGAR